MNVSATTIPAGPQVTIDIPVEKAAGKAAPVIKEGLSDIFSKVHDFFEPISKGFPKLVNSIFNVKEILNTKLPKDKVERYSAIGQKTLILMAQAMVIGAAIYGLSLGFAVFKLALFVGASTLVYNFGNNKPTMDKLALKFNERWNAPKENKDAEEVAEKEKSNPEGKASESDCCGNMNKSQTETPTVLSDPRRF